MQEAFLVHEILEGVEQGHQLAQDGGQGGALDTHAQHEDEDGVQDGVGDHREQGEAHGQLRIAGRPYHGVEAEVQVRDHVAQGDDGHVASGEGERGVRCAEEAEDGVHPQQGHEGEDETREDIQRNLVGEDLARHLVVLLAQEHGDHGGCAHAHQRTERGGDVHEREGDGQAGDGQGAHFRNMADIDAVHHVVQRRGCHGDDAGNSILLDQLSDGLRAQFCRNGGITH